MKNLKLFMEDFNPVEGIISYSVEDENGDRVARAQHQADYIKTYSPETMDFFILGYLPQLMRIGYDIEIQGPMSKNLLDKLFDFQSYIVTFFPSYKIVKITANDIKRKENRIYEVKDLEFFNNVFLETANLNNTLSAVFNYYKQEAK